MACQRREVGDEQRRLDHRRLKILPIELCALHGEVSKRLTGIARNAVRLQEDIGDEQTHHIELETALAVGECVGVVSADYLDMDHHRSPGLRPAPACEGLFRDAWHPLRRVSRSCWICRYGLSSGNRT